MSMVDIAHEALLEEIFDGGSQPGSRLEIRDIAERLSMSPTPVREALAKLATQGLTVLDANRGYRVADLLTRREFHELLAARRAIEIGALTQGGRVGCLTFLDRRRYREANRGGPQARATGRHGAARSAFQRITPSSAGLTRSFTAPSLRLPPTVTSKRAGKAFTATCASRACTPAPD